MVRWNVLVAGATIIIGAAFVTGESVPPRPLVGPQPEVVKSMPSLGQKTGYFNMAKVMREYKRAKTAIERLNTRRMRMSRNLIGLRAMFLELQAKVAKVTDKDERFFLERDARLLARKIEDADREINALLNNQASSIIGELYDEIHESTVELARERGLVAVLAYPDAVTPQERESPMVKELKLKPPACQPFYLDPSVEYTDDLLERLNAKFAAETGDN